MAANAKKKTKANHEQLNASSTSSAQTDNGNIQALLASFNKLSKNFNELAKAQQFISDKYDVLVAQMKEHKKTVEQLNTVRLELAAALQKCTQLNAEVQTLKAKQNTCEQETLNTNILVRGISVEDDAIFAVSAAACRRHRFNFSSPTNIQQ